MKKIFNKVKPNTLLGKTLLTVAGGLAAIGVGAEAVQAGDLIDIKKPFVSSTYQSHDVYEGGLILPGSVNRNYAEIPLNKRVNLWGWQDWSHKDDETRELDAGITYTHPITDTISAKVGAAYWHYPHAEAHAGAEQKKNNPISEKIVEKIKGKIKGNIEEWISTTYDGKYDALIERANSIPQGETKSPLFGGQKEDFAVDTGLGYNGKFDASLKVSQLIPHGDTEYGCQVIGDVSKRFPLYNKEKFGVSLTPSVRVAHLENWYGDRGFTHVTPGIKLGLDWGKLGIDAFFNRQFGKKSNIDTQSYNGVTFRYQF